MKFSKREIRAAVHSYERPVILPDDGFSNLTVSMNNDISSPDINYYYRSKYVLQFEQIVTHRPQETEAVKDNVARTIHDTLYREIISSLQRIEYQCNFSSKEEIIEMLSKMIDRLEE